MTLKLLLISTLMAGAAAPALANTPSFTAPAATSSERLTPAQRESYRAVFAAIRGGRWDEARIRLDATPAGPLHAVARAELYLAKGSPRVELDPLLALVSQAPDMPQAAQLSRLAATRGAVVLPSVAEGQRLSWLGGKPLRARAASVKGDFAAAELGAKIQPLIKADDPYTAEALIARSEGMLTPEALTEWRQRVSWSHYLTGNDAAARLLASKARTGVGEWAVQAEWTIGMAAWRQRDYRAAQAAFETVALRGGDQELRAAGHYWASRADMALAEPQKVQARLRAAARSDETFYGMLAAQTLGMTLKPAPLGDGGWQRIAFKPNVRAAIALGDIGEHRLADATLRHQAKIGPQSDHGALLALAARLDLPECQLYLAHNGPHGARPQAAARYPAPKWTPDGGWRVDKSLVFAHALQESNFRRDVVSPAGAYGLMQIMPSAAADISRRKGVAWSRETLTAPSTNMEYGQSYLEFLRDFGATEGKLPKIIAAYNAGPKPVMDWNAKGIDKGDPLLYIESIPYWETRGYVQIVLRNYWMYQRNAGEASPTLATLAQGKWPRLPAATRGAVTASRAHSAD